MAIPAVPPSSFLPRPRRKLCRARERVRQRALLWPDIPDALPSSGEGRGGKTDFVLLCRSFPRRCCRCRRPAELTPPPSPLPPRHPACRPEANGGSQSRRDVLSFARCDLPNTQVDSEPKCPAAAVHFSFAASLSGWKRSPNWADCERL